MTSLNQYYLLFPACKHKGSARRKILRAPLISLSMLILQLWILNHRTPVNFDQSFLSVPFVGKMENVYQTTIRLGFTDLSLLLVYFFVLKLILL
ncbi:unnamed protein product [Rhizophagus irregularis]|uniref:Uncharacterized protein n=1 Tax=Rhizophagus irregularis TaxID=588596 RepID=A0A915ZI81_9GLOM|nr:unnamed protein product [Rhizophagus irregularis]